MLAQPSVSHVLGGSGSPLDDGQDRKPSPALQHPLSLSRVNPVRVSYLSLRSEVNLKNKGIWWRRSFLGISQFFGKTTMLQDPNLVMVNDTNREKG